jgi:hypothetical protein
VHVRVCVHARVRVLTCIYIYIQYSLDIVNLIHQMAVTFNKLPLFEAPLK